MEETLRHEVGRVGGKQVPSGGPLRRAPARAALAPPGGDAAHEYTGAPLSRSVPRGASPLPQARAPGIPANTAHAVEPAALPARAPRPGPFLPTLGTPRALPRAHVSVVCPHPAGKARPAFSSQNHLHS